MTYILHIETSSELCSVAISKNENCIDFKISSEKNAQSSLLTVMIDSLLKRNDLKPEQLHAIAVSKGPGSYTGLRIGVSTAKGLAFALDIPLISVDTLRSIAQKAQSEISTNKYIIASVTDARRQEVYVGFYNEQLQILSPISTEVLHNDSFIDYLSEYKVFFAGSGSIKCSTTIQNNNAEFLLDIQATADAMVEEAFQKYNLQAFEDVAYFEPFYLKEFYTVTK